MTPSRRREAPIARKNPSGARVWVARYTAVDGRRRSAGTFVLKRDAQAAIDEAYDAELTVARRTDTIGAYLPVWLDRHPRAPRTNATNEHRIQRVLDAPVERRLLRDWPIRELRRRHALDLVDFMLTVQARAAAGAVNILRALSAMAEDAITDDLADVNPFKGVRVRMNDPRVQKQSRQPRVITFDDAHRLAATAATTTLWLPETATRPAKTAGPGLTAWRHTHAESMIRVLSDCGLRLGELLGLERRDLTADTLHVRGSMHNGVFTEGDQPTKKHVRQVPVPPTLAQLLRAIPARIDTRLLFPTPSGKAWSERNWYRDVWAPARVESGVQATPHDLRHSWVTHLRALGVDPADLADAAGHTVETATSRYTHPLRASDNTIREAIG